MPTRSWRRGGRFARFVDPRPAGLTLSVLLLGSAAGCRTDSASARLPSLNPATWLARADAAEESDLRPVPEQDSPPLPPTATAEVDRTPAPFAPSPAPPPEPIDLDEEDAFYGVRPTGAEKDRVREPSWSSRFRSLFRDDPADADDQAPAPVQAVSFDAKPSEPGPTEPQSSSPPEAVQLSPPEFPILSRKHRPARPFPGRPFQPVPQVEPAAVSSKPIVGSRLPVIVPRRSSPQPVDGPVAEPLDWPHRPAERPEAPAPLLAAPPALLPPAPNETTPDVETPGRLLPAGSTEPSDGPALLW